MKPKLLVVGGTFSSIPENRKKSGLLQKLSKAMGDTLLFETDVIINGGSIDDLHMAIGCLHHYEIVVWMANVSNDEEKIRNIKEINPRIISITSKRNDDDKYSFQEIINHALGLKSNLVMEINKQPDTGKFFMHVYDPLGVEWISSDDIEEVGKVLARRAVRLTQMTRKPTIQTHDEYPEIRLSYDMHEFLEFVKMSAVTFHKLIAPAANVKRFLGNSSFRCQRGFPSFRASENLIMVSQRNVDKEYIDFDKFVPCYLDKGTQEVRYFGSNKPSVDTPVQLELYKLFPQINYMIHSHCYIQGAPFTDDIIPCGAIQEVNEVYKTAKEFKVQDNAFICINMIGHGSIAMCSTPRQFADVKYIARKLPEDNFIHAFI